MTQIVESCMHEEQVNRAMNYPTTLKKPCDEDFQLLLRHGYEVANCTYLCYQKDENP